MVDGASQRAHSVRYLGALLAQRIDESRGQALVKIVGRYQCRVAIGRRPRRLCYAIAQVVRELPQEQGAGGKARRAATGDTAQCVVFDGCLCAGTRDEERLVETQAIQHVEELMIVANDCGGSSQHARFDVVPQSRIAAVTGRCT